MPTFYGSKDAEHVLIDQYSIAHYLKTLRIKTEAVLQDTTTLGSIWRELIDTGIRKAELEFAGLYESTTGQIMNTVSGADRIVSVLLEGNVRSKRFMGFQAAVVSGAELGLQPEQFHSSSPTITVRGRVNYGWVVAPLDTRATAGNTDSTSADMGSSAPSGWAFFHCYSVTPGGGNGVTVTVRHSGDNVTFVNHTSFTKRAAAGAEVKALSSTVNRYLSIGWAWDGGSGQNFTGFVGFARS